MEGPEIFLDVNAETGAVLGQEYTIFRKGEPFAHPITGKVLGRYEEVLGHALVLRVYPRFSAARYLALPETPRPRPADGARITRARIRVAVTPVMDMTGTQADIRRVPFLVAAGLEQTKRFQVVDPLAVSELFASGSVKIEDVLARPERAMRSAQEPRAGRLGRAHAARPARDGLPRRHLHLGHHRHRPLLPPAPAGLDQRRRGAAVPLGAPAGRLSAGPRVCYALCYGRRRMKARYVVGLLFLAMLAVSGCNGLRQIAGMPVTPEPTVNLKSAETRWLLIKNPRFGDVRSEPEYIWVEEDKLPTTMTTLLRRQERDHRAARGRGQVRPAARRREDQPAPGRAVSDGGSVPRRRVDPRAGGSAAPAAAPPSAPVAQAPRPAPRRSTACAGSVGRAGHTAGSGAAGRADRRGQTGRAVAAPEPPKRGYVVCVEPTRIIIDLTAVDGLRAGSVVSLRRDTIPLVHPVTGEVLGELDDEVGTARVTEIREKFSLAEVQSTAPGAEVQVRDRVVPK